MDDQNYVPAIVRLVLTATILFFALKPYSDQDRQYFTYGTIVLFLVYCAYEVFKYGRSGHLRQKLEALTDRLLFTCLTVAVPLFAADLFDLYKFQEHITWIFAALGVIPLAIYMSGYVVLAQKSLDIVVGLNCINEFSGSYIKENYMKLFWQIILCCNSFFINISPENTHIDNIIGIIISFLNSAYTRFCD